MFSFDVALKPYSILKYQTKFFTRLVKMYSLFIAANALILEPKEYKAFVGNAIMCSNYLSHRKSTKMDRLPSMTAKNLAS